jgi:hypothetical protein
MKISRIAIVILLMISLFTLIFIPARPVKAKILGIGNGLSYTNTHCGFTVSLPDNSLLQKDFETDSYLRVILPILQSGTNLVEKYLEIECSSDPASRQVNAAHISGTSTMVIAGLEFQVQRGEEQAAGNLYQVVKYSTEKEGQYALLTCVLHSGNRYNYDPPVAEFDYEAERAVCEEIANSFTWGEVTSDPPVTPTEFPASPLPVVEDLLAHLDAPQDTFGGGPVDTHNVLLTWTSPFETVDRPYQYDLRYANFPINAENWESAIKIDDVPTPAASRQQQEAIATVPINLRYYFGIRVVDQDGALSTLGFTPSFIDTAFRPDEDGYRFCNKGDPQKSTFPCNTEWYKYPIGLTDELMMRLFGQDACYQIAGKCFYDPILSVWALANLNFGGGVCYGMSASSLALTNRIGPNDWNDPDDFAQGSKYVSEITEPNANNPVAFYHVSQTLSPFSEKRTQYEPSGESLITKLYTLFESQDPPILTMSSKALMGGGHAITPYAIEEHPNGLYQIWVYDSNWPPAYDQQPEKRIFILDTNQGTWEYELWPGNQWNNAGYQVALIPVSLYQQQPFARPKLITAFPSIFTQIEITNPQQQTIGNVNGILVNEISNARAIPYLDSGAGGRDPYYELPIDTYTVSIRSNQSAKGNLAYFGPDYALVFENLTLTPQKQDGIKIAPDGKQISYQAVNAQKLKLTSVYREAQQTITLEFTDLAVGTGQTLTMQADTNNHVVALRQLSAVGTYSLSVERLTPTSYEKFTGTSLTSAVNDTQTISYGAGGEVKILIDHQSDGDIDETRTLQRTDFSSDNSLPNTFTSLLLIIGCLSILGLVVFGCIVVVLWVRKPKKKSASAKRIQQSPRSATPVNEPLQQAIRLTKEKQYAEAFNLLRKIVLAEPNNAQAWYYLGGVLANTSRFQEAETCFIKAKQLGHPRASDALIWIQTRKNVSN